MPGGVLEELVPLQEHLVLSGLGIDLPSDCVPDGSPDVGQSGWFALAEGAPTAGSALLPRDSQSRGQGACGQLVIEFIHVCYQYQYSTCMLSCPAVNTVFINKFSFN